MQRSPGLGGPYFKFVAFGVCLGVSLDLVSLDIVSFFSSPPPSLTDVDEAVDNGRSVARNSDPPPPPPPPSPADDNDCKHH
jgi:hypothetical protein